MRVPDELRAGVDEEAAGLGAGALARASAELTRGYREGGAPRLSPAQRLAYAAVRLPATFAAASTVLREVRARAPGLRVRRLLDLGAGPGSAAWAAAEVFPELEQVTCVERDASLLALGRRLAARSSRAALRASTWTLADLERLEEALARHDLVLAAYVIGELRDNAAARLVDLALTATEGALVVIEPGSPRGFERVLRARAALFACGARLVAPCPHERACPLEGRDFCHFAARVERSAEHRRAKGATLGHEDEKFAYVAVVPAGGAASPAAARVIRRPLARGGHVVLDLCTRDGVARTVVGKREGAVYRLARHAAWGDAWDVATQATEISDGTEGVDEETP